jgi:hypothetical protein
MIDRHLTLSITTVGTGKPISYEDIALTERNPGTIHGPDQLDELQHGRDAHDHSLGAMNKVFRVTQNCNLVLYHQPQCPLPLHHIHERVVCIE